MSFAFFSREECLYSQAIFKFIRHIKRRSEAGHRIVTGPMVSGSCPFMRSPSAVANCKCSPLLRRRWHLEDGRCMTGRFTHRPKSVLGDRLRADCHGRLLGVEGRKLQPPDAPFTTDSEFSFLQRGGCIWPVSRQTCVRSALESATAATLFPPRSCSSQPSSCGR